jgi:hypothetical protein
MITYPFEYRAVKEYVLKHKIPFYCIDSSRISRQKLMMVKREVLTKKNLQTLLKLPSEGLKEKVALAYKRAAALWDETRYTAAPYAGISLQEIDEREEYMSKRLKNLVKKFSNKKIVHISGWEHIAAGIKRPNLSVLLQEFSPRRILLTHKLQSL